MCNEMFDLYVDGTKIEISWFFSDLNVPLSSVEQYTFDCEYLAYLEFKAKS